MVSEIGLDNPIIKQSFRQGLKYYLIFTNYIWV